jgi:hypothetical protein
MLRSFFCALIASVTLKVMSIDVDHRPLSWQTGALSSNVHQELVFF